MPKLLDVAKFCEGLPSITTSKIMDKKNFHAEGLFSEQIFGPLKNYTCQCGTYYGVSRSGGTCDECGVDIVNSDERRRRFAKIVLPIPVVNPVFYDLIVNVGGKDVEKALNDLMTKDDTILYMVEEDDSVNYIVVSEEDAPEDCEKWERLDAIKKIVEGLSEQLSAEGSVEWQLIYDNLDKLFLNEVIVLPPDLRPAAKESMNQMLADRINRNYGHILTKNESMNNTIIDILRDKKLFYSYYTKIQRAVNDLYQHIVTKMSKKEGLIRGNILGKRIDFSGRAVIIPDPTISIDECVLPYKMFLELFKLQIAKKLIEIEKFKVLNVGIDFVDECIEYNIPVLFKMCEEIAVDQVCILNRQPSLHRLSMLGFNVKVSLDKVIKIHPLACPPFNADFDGDQMAVYIPITEETKREVREKFLITKNFTNPANDSLTTTPSQDIILGIYMLTSNEIPDLRDEVRYKDKIIKKGMMLFNECLPSDYPLINSVIRGKDLKKILNDIKNNYVSDIVADTLDKIKKLGFKYSTLYGSTLSLKSCRVDGANDLQDVIYEGEDIRTMLEKVSSDETESFLKRNFFYSYMIESGARGSWDQARQIVLTRGFISNFKGEIIPNPIKHSFLNGLTQQEFFDSTYGSRKGLLDVALNTGSSGYLSRKLIFTCANMIIDREFEDCGTTDLLSVYVGNLKKALLLIGKYYKTENGLELVTESNYKELIGKTINVRSPIFCTGDKLCCTCYGDLWKHLDSRFVGIIAAQSLGETNTQLVLRTFHTSGVAVIKDVDSSNDDMHQQDIVNDLSVASKLLHQFKNQTPQKLVAELFNVYNRSRSIHHTHFECIVAQLMWYGDYKWRLLDNRDEKAPEFHSVQTVPSFESWLLALAFSNPKRSILKGILNGGQYTGIMDKILKGERIK